LYHESTKTPLLAMVNGGDKFTALKIMASRSKQAMGCVGLSMAQDRLKKKCSSHGAKN
jgi:hypothetical protein